MNRLAQAQRLWLARRLALLGGCAGAAGAAFVLQIFRLRLEPSGAAVQGVALLVTLIVFVILLRLVRLQLAGPGLEAPSWERHEHRASLREAPMVALAGLGIVGFMVLATPRLVADERPRATARIAVPVAEPDRSSPAPSIAAPFKTEPSAEIAVLSPVIAEPVSGPSLIEVNYRWFDRDQEESPQEQLQQEPVDPTRAGRDAILGVKPDEPGLPPFHVGIAGLAATARGNLDIGGRGARFELDLDTVRGEQSFEPGVDVTAEFPLTPESSLKIIYAGMGFFEKGRFGGPTALGSATAAEGDRYEFELRWSHLYVALAKRLTGFSRSSSFNLSVHAGAMIDHTLAELDSEASGVGAESEDGERGWASLAAGVSLSMHGPGPAGFVLEVVQSAPVNIGGQTIALTDIRTGVTLDITEHVSAYFGYRYVRAVYRLFDSPLTREGGRTAADLAVRGPAFGLDFHF